MYLFFLYLALILFFLLALTRPRYALALLAALLPAYLLRFAILGIPTNFFEVSVWLALLATLLHHESRTTLLKNIKETSRPLLILIGLFLVAAISSTLLTPTPHSLGILKSWILTPIVFGLLVARVKWAAPLIISGVIVSLIGLFQLSTLDRITSVYDVPNSLALFIAPLIILAFFRGSFLNYIAAFIMFLALPSAQSLAGLASIFIVLFLSHILPGLRILSLPITRYSLLFLLLLSPAFLTFSGRLSYFLQPAYNSTTHTSLTVRQQLWSISWELIKEHPIRGIGLGQFEPAYQQKLHERFQKFSPPARGGRPACRQAGQEGVGGEPIPEFVFRDPHNWMLSFWLNTGLLGLLSFAALNFLALKGLFRRSNYSLQPTHYTLLTILIFGLVDTIYWKNDLAALQWLLLLSILRKPTRGAE